MSWAIALLLEYLTASPCSPQCPWTSFSPSILSLILGHQSNVFGILVFWLDNENCLTLVSKTLYNPLSHYSSLQLFISNQKGTILISFLKTRKASSMAPKKLHYGVPCLPLQPSLAKEMDKKRLIELFVPSVYGERLTSEKRLEQYV
jgi:hypothetical protein